MITSDKFETPYAAFRSRFISPVYFKENDTIDLCLSLKYNIYGKSNDGFKMLIENYLEPYENIDLFQIRGPLIVNKWHSKYFQISGLNFSQFRVIFNFFLIKTFKIINREF